MATSGQLIVLAVCSWYVYTANCQSEQLKIGAFNVQIFGTSKFSKPDVVTTLSKVYTMLLHDDCEVL